MSEERLGFVGVVIENRASVQAVNEILSAFGHIIRGRLGVPDHENGDAVIGLIVRGDNNSLGAMTGRLGNLPGVQVKSALASPQKERDSMRHKDSSPLRSEGMTNEDALKQSKGEQL